MQLAIAIRIEKISNNLSNIKPDNHLVYCLTELNNSLLMWAHYGSHLRGACICFNTAKDEELFSKLKQVIYTDEKCKIADKNLYITKSEEWAYEKEWRIIYRTKDTNKKFCHTSAINGIIIGEQMSLENRQKILKTALDNSLPIYIAKANPTKYQIDIFPDCDIKL